MVEIEQVVENLERFYQEVTGRSVVSTPGQIAAIPPEKGIDRHLDEQIDRLLSIISGPSQGLSALGSFGQLASQVAWQPACSIIENDQETNIYLDVPGVLREDIKIQATRTLLTIEGIRHAKKIEGEGEQRVRRAEQWQGKFRHQFALSSGLLYENLVARLHEGVLELRIPKSLVQDSARDISISS